MTQSLVDQYNIDHQSALLNHEHILDTVTIGEILIEDDLGGTNRFAMSQDELEKYETILRRPEDIEFVIEPFN